MMMNKNESRCTGLGLALIDEGTGWYADAAEAAIARLTRAVSRSVAHLNGCTARIVGRSMKPSLTGYRPSGGIGTHQS